MIQNIYQNFADNYSLNKIQIDSILMLFYIIDFKDRENIWWYARQKYAIIVDKIMRKHCIKK